MRGDRVRMETKGKGQIFHVYGLFGLMGENDFFGNVIG